MADRHILVHLRIRRLITGAQHAISLCTFVATAVAQAMRWYDAEKLGASRMAIGNAIRLMCHAGKSREGDHFGAAIALRAQLEGIAPTIPDWANDQHTLAWKKLG